MHNDLVLKVPGLFGLGTFATLKVDSAELKIIKTDEYSEPKIQLKDLNSLYQCLVELKQEEVKSSTSRSGIKIDSYPRKVFREDKLGERWDSYVQLKEDSVLISDGIRYIDWPLNKLDQLIDSIALIIHKLGEK